MGLSICQTCGIIVRGQSRRRCRSCQSIISKNLPTPLAVFGLKESAPVGAVNYRTDHLLLERVLEVAQTDKLVWESPCKNGECIHLPKDENAEQPAQEKSSNGDVASQPSQANEPGADSVVEPDKSVEQDSSTDTVNASDNGQSEQVETSNIKEKSSTWILTTSGTSSDGLSNNIQIALEDIGAEPLPDSQSFSATTLVFGSALDERVVTAEPQDLKELYEQSIKSQPKEVEAKDEPKELPKPKVEDKATKELFAKVEKTASAIFDQPNVGGSERDYSEEYKDATRKLDRENDPNSTESGTSSDEWPEESYERGTSKPLDKRTDSANDSNNPYKSQFDLSAIKKPGADSGAQQGGFNRSQMLKSKGSIFAALAKIAVITVVFVGFGLVGLFFLGGSQSGVADSGSISVNEMGLPVLTGKWHIELVVETPQGEIGYGEIDADVVQTRDEIVGTGQDGNGKFNITGNLGQSEKVMIAFYRHYDLNDGRQHPNPTRFKGVVSVTPGDSVLATGSFANRLMLDMPELNKRQFEQIQGYWKLSLKSESPIEKLRKSLGI